MLTGCSTSREALNHLTCVAFLSASDGSIEAVKKELAKPKYGSYYLCTFLLLTYAFTGCWVYRLVEGGCYANDGV